MGIHFRSVGLLSTAALAVSLTTPSAFAAPPAAAPGAAPTALAAPAPPSGADAARLPVTFTRNDGQAPSGVRYLGATAGVSIGFTHTGVALNLARAAGQRPTSSSSAASPATTSVNLRFVHANAHPHITGAHRSTGTVNDFHGSDPSRWHTNIPTYGQVVYHDLWPGIDGTFNAKNGTLKYSFTLAPGADPDDIRLSYTGAKSLTVDRDGGLAIAAGTTVLHDQAPLSYQTVGGVHHQVTTGFRLLGHDTFGFTLAHHTTTAPLTIDPGLDYGTFLGGSDGNASSAFTFGTDAAGDLFVFGETASVDFPSTPGAYQATLNKGGPAVDFIVSKLDPTGTHLLYSTFVGGSGLEGYAQGAVGSGGAVYVAGDSFSDDFPSSADAYRRTPYLASRQAVAFKLDPNGSHLVYGTYLAPDLSPEGSALGDDGTLTIAGEDTSDYAPTTPDAFQTVYPGGEWAGYVIRLNPTGSGLVFATYLGTEITDQLETSISHFAASVAFSPVVDAAGATYIFGESPTKGGSLDANALIKLDPSGDEVDYAHYIGNPVDGTAPTGTDGSLALDKAGDVFVGLVDLPGDQQPTTPDAYQSECVTTVGACTGYAEYSPTGTLIYGTYFGSTTGSTVPSSLKVDDDGRVYITGLTEGNGLPVTSDAYATDPGDFSEAFFLAVLGKGTLLYSTYFGGTGTINLPGGLRGVVGDIFMGHAGSGVVYLGGITAAPDFPVTPDSYQPTYPGGVDTIWAAKLTLPDLPPGTAPAKMERRSSRLLGTPLNGQGRSPAGHAFGQ